MEQDRLSIQDYRAMPSMSQCAPQILEKVTTEDLKLLLAEYVLTEPAKRSIIDELNRREPSFE